MPPADRPFPEVATRDGQPTVAGQTPYHRLPRISATWAWWRMLIAFAVGGLTFGVLQVVVLGLALVIEAATGGVESIDEVFAAMLDLDPTRPVLFAATVLSIAVLIPSAYLGYRVAGLRPVGLLSSVRLRLRWGWLARCTVFAVVTLVVALGLGQLVAVVAGQTVDPVWTPWPSFLGSALLILALVPFQSAAEEFVFRGVLVQALGSWLPQRAWSMFVVVLVPTLAFVSGHLYNIWGLLDVGAFALAAMWVTLRTGGLEAAIALHVVNNVVVFLLLASGFWGSTTQDSEGGSLIAVLITAITSIGYCIAVEVSARRRGIERYSVWPQMGSTPSLALPLPVAGGHMVGGAVGAPSGPRYPRG